jgi:hypothetical protein
MTETTVELAHVERLERTGDVIRIYFSTGLVLSGMREGALRLAFESMLAQTEVEISRECKDGDWWIGIFSPSAERKP